MASHKQTKKPLRRRKARNDTSSKETLSQKVQKRINPTKSWRNYLVYGVGLFGALVGALVLAFMDDSSGPSSLSKEAADKAEALKEKMARQAHYQLLEVFPHDPKAFTQGLTWFQGRLYEGTGMYGASELRQVDVPSGDAILSHKLEDKYFGEGISHYTTEDGQEHLIQITWKAQTGFVYKLTSSSDSEEPTHNTTTGPWQLERQFAYETVTKEGWGITYNPDKREFIVSDGSSWLIFWDRDQPGVEKRRVQVQLPDSLLPAQARNNPAHGTTTVRPVRYLNELEWQRGSILANIWYQNAILRIDEATGFVLQVYDFSALYTNREASADCFNGISVTDQEDELFVTGKYWPSLYRVKLLI